MRATILLDYGGSSLVVGVVDPVSSSVCREPMSDACVLE